MSERANGTSSAARDGGQGAGIPDKGEHSSVVLCVDAHPTRPLLVSCGHLQEGSIQIWEHRSS